MREAAEALSFALGLGADRFEFAKLEVARP